MREIDSIQPFIFEHAPVRGYVANLTQTYQSIMSQRPYPPAVKKLLGEAMISCLFLAASLKFAGTLSLQFQGDERLPLLVVQCDNQLQMRAMAQYKEHLTAEDYNLAFLKGTLSQTLSTPQKSNVYQSIVPISSPSISDNLMLYLTQSEQITNQVWLAVSEQQVAGVMLQLMPEQTAQQHEQFWEYAQAMGHTLTDEELFTLDNKVLLTRLYHETDVRIFESRSVQFKCTCSVEKMKHVILMLGENEVQQELDQSGSLEINCNFCNQHFTFDAIDCAALFHPKSINRCTGDDRVAVIKEIKNSSNKNKK